MQPLEALKRRERLGDFAQGALAHRHQIKNVAVLGYLDRQRLGSPQGLRMPAGLEQLVDAANFQLNGRRSGI